MRRADPESVYKPDSVNGDHLSRRTVTCALTQPTRRLSLKEGEARVDPQLALTLLLGFAPNGGCLATTVTGGAGGLLHHLFTLTPPEGDALTVARSVSVALSTGCPARGLPGIAP